jgi:AbiV family abortive infection protein
MAKSKYNFCSLGIEEATQGAQACIDNAKRLMESAGFLIGGGFIELATFAGCTAIEETGKALLLLDYREKKLDRKVDAAKNLNARFGDHFPKLKTALTVSELNRQAIGLMVDSLFRDPPESATRYFWKKIDALKEPNVQSQVTKTLGTREEMIYTDYIDGRFITPKDKAQKDIYDSLVKTSRKVIAQAERDLAKMNSGLKRGSIQDQAIEAIHHEFKKP